MKFKVKYLDILDHNIYENIIDDPNINEANLEGILLSGSLYLVSYEVVDG